MLSPFSPLVLDMARHVPLYRALLELLRAIASCTSMVPLLLPLSTENGEEEEEEEEQSECQTSVGTLLAKMKTCVDTYTNRLRYSTMFPSLDLAFKHFKNSSVDDFNFSSLSTHTVYTYLHTSSMSTKRKVSIYILYLCPFITVTY